MMNKLFKVIIAVLIVYIGITCVVYAMQRTLVFSAVTERILPDASTNPRMEEITLKNKAGERLFSWHGQAPANRPTVLYLHGNGGSVGTRQSVQRQFLEKDYGIFMAGYPGYGGSDGAPTEAGLLEAAELAYRHLIESGVAAKQIIIFGESLGSSVATQLAKKVSASALVLAAPMHSIREIAKAQYPFLAIGLLLKDPFLTFEHIGDVDEPVLVFHGSADQAIPIDSGKRLFALANEPKQFHTIDSAGHNNLFDFGIIELLDQFLAENTQW